MRWVVLAFSALVLAGITANGIAAEATRTALILDRLNDANRWRNHVMVVAHRAGWKEGGTIRFAENSLASIDYAVSLGAEIVEMDIRKSADGRLIVMHDSWLDRTTDCRGEVDKHTLAELKACRLVVEGNGVVTDENVPTLTEALVAARGRILVNIDNKLGPEILPEIAAEARALGMADGILIKENVWNTKRISDTGAHLAAVGNDVTFMPIFADDAVSDAAFMATATGAFSAPAAELVNWHQSGAPLTQTGGPLFSAKARAAAIAGNWHLWVNTYPIVNKPGAMLAGGRGDELAVFGGRPDEAYGFWVDRGATIIQTDEPKLLIGWLEKNGYRIPYDLTN